LNCYFNKLDSYYELPSCIDSSDLLHVMDLSVCSQNDKFDAYLYIRLILIWWYLCVSFISNISTIL